MTAFDFIVLAAIAFSGAVSVMLGFTREARIIFGILGAVFAAFWISPTVAGFLRGYLPDAIGLFIDIATFIAIFLAGYFAVSWATDWLCRLIKLAHNRRLDQGIGLAFGALRGLALVCLGYLVYQFFTPVERQPNWVRDAATYPIVKAVADVFVGFAPENDRLMNDDDGADEAAREDGATQTADGYDRLERDSLEQLITTTTADEEDDPQI